MNLSNHLITNNSNRYMYLVKQETKSTNFLFQFLLVSIAYYLYFAIFDYMTLFFILHPSYIS